MSEITIYLKAIRDIYPDFVIEKVHQSNPDGQFNNVLVINNDFIFRFPQYKENISNLAVEIRLLRFIHSYISLPIPNPVYSNIDRDNASKSFMGYKMISGEPLWLETFTTIIDWQTLQRLANQLGNFLKELHNIPIDKLPANVPAKDSFDEWVRMYSEVRQNLYQFMRSDAQAWVTNHFETYFRNSRLHTHERCLRHGDFGTGNILYNNETRAVSGIIDFGSIGLGDPAVDIAAVSCYGENFVKRVYCVYPEIEPLWERAQFYKGTYALQEALHGFKNDDQEAFENGIAEYI
jgi:aminoglycoside 2''-phosphotransferase